MRVNKLYKHKLCSDTAFKPYYIVNIVSDGTVETKGYWVNITNPGDHFVIIEDEIVINKKDLKNWEEISNG